MLEIALLADLAAYSKAACARTRGAKAPIETQANIRQSVMPAALLIETDRTGDRNPAPRPFILESTRQRMFVETVAAQATNSQSRAFGRNSSGSTRYDG